MDIIIEVVLEVIYAIGVNEGIKKGVNKSYKERQLTKGLPQNSKESFLLFVVLMYLFYENDGRFSIKEKRIVNNELKNKKSEISNEDYTMYKSILSKKQKIEDIKQLVIDQEYDPITVSRVLRIVRNLLIMDKTYYNGIKTLETTLYELI